MDGESIFYIATSIGVVGVAWAIAFIVYVVCKYNKED